MNTKAGNKSIQAYNGAEVCGVNIFEDETDEAESSGYVVSWDWGAREVISNFDVNTDSINLSQFWTRFNNFSISEDGRGNLDINLLDIDNHTITLEDVSLAAFGANNIKGVAGNFLDAVIDHPVQYYSYTWDFSIDHTIDDFNPETGIFELIGFSRSFSDYEIYNNAEGDAVINIPFNSQSITLIGVNANELSADNFLGVSGNYANACHSLNDYCVIEPNQEKNTCYLDYSLMLIAALTQVIGYSKSSKIAKTVFQDNCNLKEACLKLGSLSAEEFDRTVVLKKVV